MDRERERVERGAALTDSAEPWRSSRHPGTGGYEFEKERLFEVEGRICAEADWWAKKEYPDCEDSRLRFKQGWRHARNGYVRLTLYEIKTGEPYQTLDPAKAKGWDTYTRERGPYWWTRSKRGPEL